MQKEKFIKIDLKNKSYNIVIKYGLLSKCGTYLKNLKLGKKILIITQNKVPLEYTNKVQKSLRTSGYKVHTFVLPSGESYKNLNSLLKIINFAIKNKYERNDSFCALGGGVISDLTGFAASIYYRGVNFICIPTTLLGMVDAAIGGKTGINIKEGKNLIGAFYQPKIVLVDPICLKTLPKREFLTGMGEIIKYALLEKTVGNLYLKRGFFYYLSKNSKQILNLHPQHLNEMIFHSANVKAKIVSRDEKENGLRSILNLGHTFAHGIEQAYDYKKYTHGEAVSIGMCLATKLALKHNLITKEDANTICNLIKTYGLPTKFDDNKKTNKIMRSMLHDKKIKDGKLRFVLPYQKLGSVKITTNSSKKEIEQLLMQNASK